MTEFTMDRLRENLEALKMKNTLEILDNYLERAVADKLNIVEVLDHIFSEEAKSKRRRAYEKQIQMSGLAWCKNLCKRNSTKSRMTLRKQGRLGAEALPNRRSRRTGRYARRWRCECRPGCRDNLRERVSQRPGRRT